jgi:hypothetical protein
VAGAAGADRTGGGALLADVEFERRIWRSHQPQLRREPDRKLPGELNYLRVANDLRRAVEDARRGLEDLEADHGEDTSQR